MELNLERAQEIKEVLEMMLDVYCHPDNHFDLSTLGMCITLTNLHYQNQISKSKRILVQDYIENNVPSTFSSWSRFSHVVFGVPANFFFKPGARKPRIKWLKYHILKLQVLIDVLKHQQKLTT